MAIPFLTNTSFSAAITVATTGTFGGNITISNASPALNLTDTDNSSNIAFSSVGGALIVNSPSDQVYQIGGTEKFRISSSTATFTSNITLNGDGRLLKFTPTSYDDVELGIDSNGFVIYNTTDARYDLKISGAGNATFAGAVGVGVNAGSNAKLEVVSTTGEVFRADSSGGAFRLVVDQTGVNTQGVLAHTGTATFSGLVSGITPVAAANFVTKAYVDGGGGLTGFLPLSAGSGFPLTGDLFLTLSSSTQRALSSNGTNSLQIGDAGVQELKFKNASGTSFLINSSGRVGIGTTSPQSGFKLDVNGPAIVRASAYVLTDLVHYGSSDFNINASNGSTNIKFEAGSSERMRITSGGNVGIGTNNPDNRLDVVVSDVNITPNAESSAVFRRNGNNYLTILSNASNEGGILFGNAVDDNDGAIAYKHNTQSMQFSTADVERMRIDSNGTVLINATAPTQTYGTGSPIKLSVQDGMSEFETTLTNNNDWENSPVSILERANIGAGSTDNKYAPNLNFHWRTKVSNSLWLGANGNLNYGSYTSGGVPAVDGTFAAGNFIAALNITGNTGSFTGQVTGPTPTTTTSFANKAYVDAHGGGTGPFLPLAGGRMTGTAKIEFNNAAQYIHALSVNDLDIVAGDDINYRSNFSRFFSGTTEHARITGVSNNNWIANGAAAHKLGIGTTSPSSKLQVSGDAYVTEEFGQGVAIANKVTAYGGEFRTSGASAQIFFGRSGNNIGSGGIGADSTYVFRVWTVPGFGNPFVIKQDGNVGIGLTNPDAKLVVNGDIKSLGGGSFVAGVVFGGAINLQNNITILNKAQSAYIPFATRNLTGSEVVMDLTNVGSINGGAAGPYLPLAGGTLTGHLNGTTGNFTGNVAINGTIIGSDQTFGNPYRTFAFGSNANGSNRIFATTDATDGIYINAATGKGVNFRVNGGGSNVMVITSSGNVGIGTTSPGARLDVLGKINQSVSSSANSASFTNSDATSGYGVAIQSEGTSNTRYALILRNLNGSNVYGGVSTMTNQVGFWGIGASPTGTLGSRLTVGGNASIGSGYIANSAPANGLIVEGNVGIGTNNPSSKLTVADGMDGSNSQTGLEFIPQDSSNRNIIFSYDRSSSAYKQLNFDASDFRFNPGGGTKMVILNNGNVGIGTTNPNANLHVVGTGLFTGDVNITQTAAVGVLSTANLDNGSAVGLSLTYPASNVAAGDGLAIAIGIAGRGRSYIANSNKNTNLDASNLAFYTESGGVIGERMIINQDGKVGIGVTGPTAKLHVSGNTKLLGGIFSVSTDAAEGSSGFSYKFRDAVGINNPNSVSAPAVAGYVMSVGRSTSSGVGGGIYVEGESRFVRGLAGGIKFNAYDGTNQVGTPTYILGTDAAGNVVKVLGSSVPGSVSGSGTLNKIPLWTPNSSTIGDSMISQVTTSNVLMKGAGNNFILSLDPDNNAIGDTSTVIFNDRARVGWFNSAVYLGDGGSNKDIKLQTNLGDIISLTSNTERMRITSAGKVGIGTTSLAADSLVTIGTTASTGLTLLSVSNAGESFLNFADTDDINVGRIYYGHGDNAMRFRTNDGLRMIIDSSGNVGIGKASPERILHLDANGGRPIIQIDKAGDKIFSVGTGTSANDDDNTILQMFDEGTEKIRLFTVGDSYLNGGNVGIGTTSPSKKLDVAGSFKLGTNAYIEYGGVYPYTISTLNTAAVGNLIFNAGAGSSGYESKIELQGSNTAADDAITFTTGSSTAMVIQVNGNVGIGRTARLNDTLTVTKADTETAFYSTNAAIEICNSNTSVGNWRALNFKVGAGNYSETLGGVYVKYANFSTNVTGNLILATRGPNATDVSARITINEVGAVKFDNYNSTNNTGSPTHILGTDANGLVVKSTAGSSIGPWLPLAAGSGDPLTGDLYINKSAPALRLNDSGSNKPYELRVDAETFSIKEVSNSRTLMSITTGAVITLDSLGSSTVINTSGAMVVPNGKVGIGTTSPTYDLDIQNNNGRIRMLGSTGFVALDLQNTAQSFYVAREGNTGGNFATGGTAYAGILAVQGNYNLEFATNGVVRQTITGAGNVGIGTASPSQTLEVHSTIKIGETGVTGGRLISGDSMIFQIDSDGSSTSSSYRFRCDGTADDGNELMRIQENGNVGIGVTNPASELAVEGHIRSNNDNSGDFLDIFCDGDGTGSSFIQSSSNDIVIRPQTGFVSIKANAFGSSGSNASLSVFNSADTSKILLNSNGISYLNGGNVGIGTTAINGSFGASNTVLAVKGKTSGGEGIIQITGLGNNATDNVGALAFHSYNEADAMCSIRSIRGNADDVGNMAFLTNNGGTESERMRISSTGAIKFNAYGAGTLVTDASGNVTVSSSSGVTGSGANTRIAFWNGTSAITSDADLTFDASTNKLISNLFQIPNNGDYLGVDTSGNARTLISLTNTNDVEISNSALSTGSDTVVFFGDSFKVKDGGNTRLLINSSGNVGIGNTLSTSSSVKLEVTGNTLLKNSNGVADLYLGNYATANHFRFHTNNANSFFDMNCGDIYWRQGSSTRYTFFASTANMTVQGTITQNSDIRIKENIVEIGDCINKVKAMRGVYYNRTDFNTEPTKVGVIAQEVEAVLPELVLDSPEDGLKSVAYSELTAVLINAIKEQQEIIEDLKTRVQQLEN